MASSGPIRGGERLREDQKGKDVRMSNIVSAQAVATAIRTSLGPRGMDKMIQGAQGDVVITNDGATILSKMKVFHPTAKMLVELSKSQDIEAGDGTTSVCVIAGSLLGACTSLLEKGIHPTAISEAFQTAFFKAEEVLESVAMPVDFNNRQQLIHTMNTCLSSKVVSQNAEVLSPIAVDAVLEVLDPAQPDNVDLNDIRIVKQLGGTVDDSELIRGIVFDQGAEASGGGPTAVENAKIGLIQFCLSAPKTDMENNVVISDYAAMDRILREERKHILGLCKKIKKAGCTVLLVQKSILRDATNDLSLHFLAKMGILVVKDVERKDIEFITRTLGCQPVAHVDSFTADKLGSADLVEQVSASGSTHKVCKITGVANPGRTMSILVRGSNRLVLDEADRSIHDALCVMRCLVKKKYMISGGGAPETQISVRLSRWAQTQPGMTAYCVKAYAEALEVIPYTLAENAGLNPIRYVTELRQQHNEGNASFGINVRSGTISDMVPENVLQPLLVSTSALGLATETVRMILKIDDIVQVR